MLVDHLFLGFPDYARHHPDGLDRILSRSRFPREHKAISLLHHRIEDIRHFRSRREGVLHHGFEQLGRDDDEFSMLKALLRHLPLIDRKHLDGGLDPEVSTGDHDPVGSTQYLQKVLHSLGILDLRDDFYVRRSILIQEASQFQHILLRPHEALSDEAEPVADREKDVLFVFLRQSRELDLLSGQIHMSPRSDRGIVQCFKKDMVFMHTDDSGLQESRIDLDDIALMEILKDVGIIAQERVPIIRHPG